MATKARFEPDVYYDDETVAAELEMTMNSISRACNSGELRSTPRGSRRFIRGQWAIDWLEGVPEEREEVARAS